MNHDSGRTLLMSLAVAGLLLSVSPVRASDTDARFLVVAPHTKEECLQHLDDVKAVGTKLLNKTDWGCMAGDHTGYVTLEAKDEAAVRKMVPSSWAKAKIVKLNKFTGEQIESFHKK